MELCSTFRTLFWDLELELIAFALIKATITSTVLSLYYPNFSLIAFPAITTFIYIQDRIYPDTEDLVNDTDAYNLIQKYKSQLSKISIISLGIYELLILTAAISFFQQGNLLATLITITVAQYPILAYIPYNTFKEHLLLDTLAVSTSWTIMAILLPQIFTNTLFINETVVYLSAFYFFGETALVELYNIPDIDGDKKNNKTTLPTKIGQSQTTKLTLILSVISITSLTLITTNLLPIGLGVLWLGSEYYLIKPQISD